MKKFDFPWFIAWILAVSLIVTNFYAQGHVDVLEERVKQHETTIKEQQQELELLREREERIMTLSSKEEVVRVVMAEARGQSLKGQMAVAQVILDRSIEWGMSSGEVVNSPYQFTTPYEGEIDPISEVAVDLVYICGERVFEEPTLYFYNPSKVTPYWADDFIERGVIEGHRFMG